MAAVHGENLAEAQKGAGWWQRLLGWRHRSATIAIFLIAVWLAFRVVSGPNGWIAYRSKKAQNRELQQQFQQLQAENQELERRVNALRNNDPRAIEREAREQFHWAKPGEIIYVMPENKPAPAPQPPANVAAEKK
jgi:cell division protein FtsB